MPIPLSLTLFHSFGQLLIRTIMPLQHQPPNRTASRRDEDAIVLEIILLPDPPRSSHLVSTAALLLLRQCYIIAWLKQHQVRSRAAR
ncbi:hypothetical protein GWI33_017805 [Rhynchophorus ferrugineus]|uniref:Uncharacterized protein n=1 Tax=Rhynchophorus ferrugineus TaxID=354439 RepID=A0A834HXG9_RHYFE|nr:hypothetical protein GWI33_017805 [Rhynchophorus ferrugineus]